jgi:hypothetical protein
MTSCRYFCSTRNVARSDIVNQSFERQCPVVTREQTTTESVMSPRLPVFSQSLSYIERYIAET